MILKTTGSLVGRFEKLRGTGTIIRLDHAFMAFSGDVIGNICCGHDRANFLDDENFSPEWCVQCKLFNILFVIVLR